MEGRGCCGWLLAAEPCGAAERCCCRCKLRLLPISLPLCCSTVTGGLSYQETLGGGQRKGLADCYQPEASCVLIARCAVC